MASIPWITLIDEPHHRALQCPDTGAVVLDVTDEGNFYDHPEYTYLTCQVRKDRIEGHHRNPEKHIREVARKFLDISEECIEVINPCEIEKSLFDYVEQLKGAQHENVRSVNSHSANL